MSERPAPEGRPIRAAREVNDHFLPAETPAVDVALNEPLLTADAVAVLLSVPRSSVYEYARRLHNPLPAMRVGRHVRFYRSDVETWLAEQRGSAA
jgi:excisionase family DNA binding protein